MTLQSDTRFAGGDRLTGDSTQDGTHLGRLPDLLASAAAEMVRRVQRSLVVLHNGHHGVGAGIVWGRDPRGGMLILTNHHVVDHQGMTWGRRADGQQLRAELEDSTEVPVRLLAKDAEVDLALLAVDIADLPVAMVADAHGLRVGQLVLAVGHPWRQRGVVTAGLVSSLTKAKTDGRRGSVDVIRSDARLAPGNSGGPLVNANGAVVGINTLIVGGDQGIAIPSYVANDFVEQSFNT